MNNPIISVPLSLLLAPLPPTTKLVWQAIKSLQGSNAGTSASLERIGARLITYTGKPTGKATVSRAVKQLKEAGFLTTDGQSLSCSYGEGAQEDMQLEASADAHTNEWLAKSLAMLLDYCKNRSVAEVARLIDQIDSQLRTK